MHVTGVTMINTARIKLFLVCLVLCLSTALALLPVQKTVAAGESYRFEGANIIGAGGAISGGPGPGDTMFRVGNISVQTMSDQMRESQIFAMTTDGTNNWYSATQTWNFLAYPGGGIGVSSLTCRFSFTLLLTSVNNQGSPGSGGETTYYSPGTISVESIDSSARLMGVIDQDPVATCDQIADRYNNVALDRSITVYGQAPDVVVPSTPPPNFSDDDKEDEKNKNACDKPKGQIGWMFCPASNMFIEAANRLDQTLVGLVMIDTEPIFSTNPGTLEAQSSRGFRTAWGIFRNLAYVLLIIIGLIMIISQVMGLDLFDAYTIRKMLPKIVLAVIFIPLMWPILNILFNMANDSAGAIAQLITAPFDQLGRDKTGFDTLWEGAFVPFIMGSLITVGVVTAIGGIGVLFAAAASAALFVLSAVFILYARDIVAYILIIASPIAIVCAAFEPFKKVFSMWRGFLTTILLSIPAIAAVLAASKVGAIIALLADDDYGYLVALIIIISGYAMFWFVFKQIDKVSGQLGNVVSKATGGLQQRLSKYRKDTRARNLELFKRGMLNNRFGRTFRGLGERWGAAEMVAKNTGSGFASTFFRGSKPTGAHPALAMRFQQAEEALQRDAKSGNNAADDNLMQILGSGRYHSAEAAARALADKEKISFDEAMTRVRAAENSFGAAVGTNVMSLAASLAASRSKTSFTPVAEDLDLSYQEKAAMLAEQVRMGNMTLTQAAAAFSTPGRPDTAASFGVRLKAIQEAVTALDNGASHKRVLGAAMLEELRQDAAYSVSAYEIAQANPRALMQLAPVKARAYQEAVRMAEEATSLMEATEQGQFDAGRIRAFLEEDVRRAAAQVERMGGASRAPAEVVAEAQRARAALEQFEAGALDQEALRTSIQDASRRAEADAALIGADLANIHQALSYSGGQAANIMVGAFVQPVRQGPVPPEILARHERAKNAAEQSRAALRSAEEELIAARAKLEADPDSTAARNELRAATEKYELLQDKHRDVMRNYDEIKRMMSTEKTSIIDDVQHRYGRHPMLLARRAEFIRAYGTRGQQVDPVQQAKDAGILTG